MSGDMDRKRRARGFLIAVAAAAAVTAGAVGLHLAWAAPPAGCTYPSAPDNFAAVAPGQNLTSAMFNRILCALNAIEAELAGGAAKVAEQRCMPVTVAAGARVLVDVPMTRSMVGTEPVFGEVVDGASPSRLVADGVQSRSGSLVRGWVWNRDADAARSGQYCVEVWPL